MHDEHTEYMETLLTPSQKLKNKKMQQAAQREAELRAYNSQAKSNYDFAAH